MIRNRRQIEHLVIDYIHRYDTLWVPETRPWSWTCRDGGRC